MKQATKDKILDRAARIFFAEGFAVGIDRITLECDTAKMTIYTAFQSKDGLICAILQEVRRGLSERIGQLIEPALAAPARMEAMFDLICYGMNDPALELGLGVRALAEFPDGKHPVHHAVLELDGSILRHLQPEGGSPTAAARHEAQQLLLLAKGCFLLVPLLGLKDRRQSAVELGHLRLNQRGERSCVFPAATGDPSLLNQRPTLTPATPAIPS